MSDEFKPGQRVEIQERDRDPDRYPQATIVRAATRQEMFGNHDIFGDQRHDQGYVVRHDDGQEEWVQEWDVLAMRNPDSRIVDKAVAELVTDGWEDSESLSPEDLRQIALTVLRAAQQWQASQVEREFTEKEPMMTDKLPSEVETETINTWDLVGETCEECESEGVNCPMHDGPEWREGKES